jgi:hypothetical protein
MDASEVLEVVDLADWSATVDAATQARAIAGLEAGRVVFLPHLAFSLWDSEREFLTPEAGDASRKNVSRDPSTGRTHGTAFEGEKLARLGSMLERYGAQATALVRALYPQYAASLEQARTSFRPAEIKGREYTPRHDDRLLHVDAFPTRPMQGRRILRVFANVAEDGTQREWRVGENFSDFARKFFPQLRGPLPGQSWAMHTLGLTKSRRSAYDHFMLGLHDAGKLDAGYQATAPKADVAFPPHTVWMCFTDSVLHAALAGRCALEQTIYVPVEAMARPELAPLRVLEGIAGRSLV